MDANKQTNRSCPQETARQHAEVAITAAETHLSHKTLMHGSALLCLNEARRAALIGDYGSAQLRAARSLAYSVGVFHPAYNRVMSIWTR